MTIETITSSIAYQGNGATTTFSYAFLIPDQDNLVVTITDSDGNETELLTSEYSVTGIDDPAGGIVTYPLSGSPLALAEYITIQRDMPLTQETDLSNQGGYYPDVVEAALDNLEMQIQQVYGAFSRALVAPLSDPAANLTIPNAESRAGFYLAFDSDGDPIAGTPVSGATVSSVMVPVVEAATLAAARIAMGLGAVSTLAVGTGLRSDGTNLTSNADTTADTTSQAVTSAFNGTTRIATGPITYTLARANTLWDGFSFLVFCFTGVITITPNAADAIGNLSVGTSLTLQPGMFARITTDGAASGEWYIDSHYISAALGPGNMLNGYMVFTNNGTAGTIAIKTLSGNDPSTVEPVYFFFRNATATSGVPVIIPVTAALSMSLTNTALIGFTAALGSRLWVAAQNNGGAVELAVINCKTSTTIYPLQARGIWTTTAMTAASDSGAVPYSTSARSNVPYSVLGYGTWETGLAVAGVWDANPTTVEPYVGGSLPNDIVNRVSVSKTDTATFAVGTVGTYVDVTGMSVAITVLSAANAIELGWAVNLSSTSATTSLLINPLRGSTSILRGDAASNRIRALQQSMTVSASFATAMAATILDFTPGTGAVTYKLQMTSDRVENAFINRSSSDTDTTSFARSASIIVAREIMA